MKTSELKAWELEEQLAPLQAAQAEIAVDACEAAERYVKSAKVDLGGE